MFVFILGTGRCGSSLVHEVVARHPDVGFVSNLDDRLSFLDSRGRWNSTVYRAVPAALSRKGRARYAPSEAYRLLAREVSPMLSQTTRDLEASDLTPWIERRTRAFFESRRSAQRKRALVHKFTGWPRAGLLGSVFPEARFVHIVRDGRAVANSFLQMPWWKGYRGAEALPTGALPARYAAEWERSARSHVVLAGITWKIFIDAHEHAQRQLGARRWKTIRYEDIIANPRREFATLLEFAGLDWTAGFESALSRHSFATSRRAAFRDDLSARQQAELERCLADHLGRYGYATDVRQSVTGNSPSLH